MFLKRHYKDAIVAAVQPVINAWFTAVVNGRKAWMVGVGLTNTSFDTVGRRRVGRRARNPHHRAASRRPGIPIAPRVSHATLPASAKSLPIAR